MENVKKNLTRKTWKVKNKAQIRALRYLAGGFLLVQVALTQEAKYGIPN